MGELHELSAIELAGAIARREVSSREALTHFVARVDRLDGPLNSVVTRDLDAAFAVADEADTVTVRGDALGPLHGVPMTVKDSFSTAGMRTTSGAPELAEHVPTEDAAPVAAVRRAGAVVWGKTNLPIYAGDFQSYNDGVRHDRQPMGHRTHAGRFVGRLRGRARGPVHAVGDRLGHRRLDPSAGEHVRRLRPQAELRDRAGARPDPRSAGHADPGGHRRRRAAGAHRGRPRAGARPDERS